jgi:hypothetical protein
MSSSRIPLVAALVCIAAIGVGWLLEHRSHARLEQENAVLSAPRIITGGGNEAQVSIGNDTGGRLDLSVVPNLAPDGNVDLRLKVSRSEGTGQP